MRRVTRNLILGILAVLVLLLALGALPGLLKSGDPYYVTATPASPASDSNATAQAVDGANLSERAYPYTTEALENVTAEEPGRSDPYWRGPVGFKEAFTHSPFDEMNALREQHPNATVGEGVFVSEVVRESGSSLVISAGLAESRGPCERPRSGREQMTRDAVGVSRTTNEGSSRVQRSDGVHVARNGTLYRVAVTR